MKTTRYTQAALKTTLQCCVATAVVCALMVGFVSRQRAAAEHRYAAGELRIREARARLQVATDHRALIDQYRERYRRLVGEGLKVRFDRAVAGDWFEAAIPAMDFGVVDHYVIGKDTPFAGPETAELTAFRVVSHRLEFNANVAHEDEFVDLMDSLEKRVPGITAEEACSLTRNPDSGLAGQLLKARCALVWYEFAGNSPDLAATGSPP
jgi:hypothetical protein